MGFARIDWTSDYVIFFAALMVISMIVIVALERYSPRRQARRRVDNQARDRGGELID